MKSNIEQIENRGFVAAGNEKKYSDSTFERRVFLLKSKLPAERTLGARLLSKNSDLSAIYYLTEALKTEKKLYTKIEICNSLVSFGKDSVVHLIGLLGKIGNNQHTKVPETIFKKNSYPLPRDIAGRTLIRIGPKTIPDIIKVLEDNDLKKVGEAIDILGFICFYEPRKNVSQFLEKCYYSNIDSDLIKWKIFRAMSAFPECESFLEKQLVSSNALFKSEIERSLSLIKKHSLSQ